jgi:hypothetical protein
MHRTHGISLRFLPAVLAGVLACASTPATLPEADDTSASEPSALDQRPRQIAPSVAQPDDGATLLLDPGAKPHAPLRFHPRVGDVARWTMVMTVETALNVLGNDTSSQFGIELDAQTEVVAFDAVAHEFHSESTILSARLLTEPVDRAATEAALAPYIGLLSWTRADTRGRPLEYRYTRDGTPVDPSTIAGLDDNLPTMALPEEPVGIGARWQEFDEVERNGFRVLQTSEHTLVRRQGDRLTIETTVLQQPLSNTMQGANMPPGTRAELRHFTSAGSGMSTFDLGRPIPVAAEMVLEGTLGAIIITDQEQAEMTMQMRIQTQIATQ